MACGFKFCLGHGKCFLEGVSPCSAHVTEANGTGRHRADVTMRQIGLKRTGFVSSVAPQDVAALAGVSARL
ncbi:MAG: hypothetical protein HKP29_03400 [Silicimonas sp.]|nr:hypothetical protein [Silicimonas sp.]NNL72390.1 hypothetical protein [Silicimonas sp.]